MGIRNTGEEFVKNYIEKNGDAFLDKQFDAVLAKVPNPFIKMLVEAIREDAKAEVKAWALTLADKIDGEVG